MFVGKGVSVGVLVLICLGIELALLSGALVCTKPKSEVLLIVSECSSGGVGVTISGGEDLAKEPGRLIPMTIPPAVIVPKKNSPARIHAQNGTRLMRLFGVASEAGIVLTGGEPPRAGLGCSGGEEGGSMT